MNIRSLLTWKTTRYVLLTVILGAVGSGAWEWILKPMLTGASDFGLYIATLGIEKFKNSLYKDIALGFREEPSLRLYSAIFGLLPMFVLGIVTGFLYSRRRSKEGTENTVVDRAFLKLFRPALVLVVFLLVFSVVQANQVAYINRAITHFQQLLAIASPYLEKDESVMYRSSFAQVASREDYAKLIQSLTEICRAKNLKAPEFSIW